MAILWLNLLLTYSSSFFSRFFSKPYSIATDFVKPNKIFLVITIFVLSVVSGLRNDIGDTFFYMHDYIINHYTWKTVFTTKDYGFGVYQMFLQHFSNDPQLLILTTAIITNVLIVITFYKYARVFEIAVYVFITSGLFTVSMNGIRQFLASAITFVALKYIIEGKFLRYLIVVLLASFIHQSALILIPIYFIVRQKAWTKLTFLLLSLSILFVLGFNQFSGLLFSTLSNTNYGVYQNAANQGANIMGVAVVFFPIFIAFIGREKLRELWPQSDVVVNLSIIGLVFDIISTQNWIFARMNIYFSLYSVILTSWIIKLFKEKNQPLMYFCLIVCYFIFFYVESVIRVPLDYRSNYL